MTIHQTIARSCLAAVCVFGGLAPAFAGPVVVAGSQHVMVLTDTGVVWVWGDNSYVQLGDGTGTTRVTPVSLAITGVTAIAAGDNSSYALKSDGSVWAWGNNQYGQLGDGTATTRAVPVAVIGLSSVIALAAGGNHAMALKSDGTLWAWGANYSGQVGDNTTTFSMATPVQVSSLGTSVLAIAANDDHSHAVKTDGTIWSWGRNQFNESGDGTTVNPRRAPVQTGTLSTMTRVAAGGYFAFAWDASGALSAWGNDGYGMLGDGTTTPEASPISIPGISTVVSLSAGYAHAIAAKANESAWAWGYNAQGQVGDGTTTTRFAPFQLAALDSVVSVAAGTYFSVAVSSDGRVWTWGRNNAGQLGDGTLTQRISPMQISDAGFAWRVPAPTFSPDGGAFTDNVTVTVSCTTAGATIHYTTNGQDPVETDPAIVSGSTVAITQTTTLRPRRPCPAWPVPVSTGRRIP